MFEELRLIGSPDASIVLHTRRGRSIDNMIECEPGPRELGLYQNMVERHTASGWRERRPATGVYNCIGHVWASRRTSVFGPNTELYVSMIFIDDAYRILNAQSENICIGDLIVYWASDASGMPRRSFLHVGVVIELKDGPTGTSQKVPWILSKWNSTSGEIFHHYNDHPLLDYVPFLERHKQKVDIEFWTDRPA